jgi:hypothetical protein
MHAFLPRTNAYIQRSMRRNVSTQKCDNELRDPFSLLSLDRGATRGRETSPLHEAAFLILLFVNCRYHLTKTPQFIECC